MKIDVVTIFPDYLAPLRESLLGKAIDRGRLSVDVHDLRDFTDDIHRTVDDTPYGGGPGMVMLPEPWGRALDHVAPPDSATQPRLIVPTPAGRRFDHQYATELATEPWLVFACGRYEGIDARVAEYARRSVCASTRSAWATTCWPGERSLCSSSPRRWAGCCRASSGTRLPRSDDSFAAGADGLLEAPSYTKPASWRGLDVPAVLLSGHHGEIAAWRRAQSLERTARVRPDLLD